MKEFKIIECPRDAMQGIHEFIPTQKKIDYIQKLLSCQFDTLDCGSFVSEKAIPQMKDTKEVLKNLDLSKSKSKLLLIVANLRGAKEAAEHELISFVGYPFSISETFQLRNTNSNLNEAFSNLSEIQHECLKNNKKLVVYLSMGFGNPYGDIWNENLVLEWIEKLSSQLEIPILSLSDTIGCATKEQILSLFPQVLRNFPKVEVGAHLHVNPNNALSIIESVVESGCTRMDGAIKGFGGCPMASDSLTGNMPTEKVLDYLNSKNINHSVDMENFKKAYSLSNKIFN
ncbi:MAG: hydroxymethylglutaryl-CoA lyase [Flavobacteriia bacterium]|nr:hydroxymethylglutaryl-CoA lyase [Flavobacteriia bacterium]